MKTRKLSSLKVGDIIEIKNAHESFFYKVVELSSKGMVSRFGVLTEKGMRYHLLEDFHSVSSKFDFNKIKVTEENVHLYYKYMSEDEKKKESAVLDKVFKSRRKTIHKELGNDLNEEESCFGGRGKYFIYKISYLRAQDNLLPLKTYISQLRLAILKSGFKEEQICLFYRHLTYTNVLKLNKVSEVLKEIHEKRKEEIIRRLDLTLVKDKDFYRANGFRYYFGVIDTLLPLDVFIEKIVASQEYYNYITSRIDNAFNSIGGKLDE